MTIRPRRSALYMPGANARALDKARRLAADVLILDLEDAVAPDAKTIAREQVVAALRQGGYGQREVVVRVNGLDTPWGEADVAAVASAGADGILFPKIGAPVDVTAAVACLDRHQAPATLPLWIMAETAAGVLAIDTIVTAHLRLQVVVMGTSDLAKELRLPPTLDRGGLLHSLSRCLLAARSRGLDILDGVHLDLDDDAGFALSCEQGRELGFDGKTLIHPRQITVTNRTFSPSPGAVERAKRLVQTWEAARQQGQGIVVMDGRLIENLHVEEAHRLLALNEAISAWGDS